MSKKLSIVVHVFHIFLIFVLFSMHTFEFVFLRMKISVCFALNLLPLLRVEVRSVLLCERVHARKTANHLCLHRVGQVVVWQEARKGRDTVMEQDVC